MVGSAWQVGPWMALALLVVGGCVLRPEGAAREAERLDAAAADAGYATDARPASRPASALPENPTRDDILRRALLANGELEAAFHAWAAAVQRIDQAGSWPTQPLELGFEYMFSGERMKSFDRMTFSGGLMDASALPQKARASAEVAWRDAESAGARFRAVKFDLQKRVLQAHADYALQAERVRIEEQNRSLLRLVSETAGARVRAGASQQEQVRAEVALRLAETELATSRAALESQRARLNGLMGRDAGAALPPPSALPAPRRVPGDDAALLAAGVSHNADLAALGADEAARAAAIRRARLEYLPEINPMAAFTGSVSQALGAAVVLPTQAPKIRAMVAEARADLRRVEAEAAQARADRAAMYLSTLLTMRDAERRARAFDDGILPLAARAVELARQGYASGATSYLDLIDAQRTLLDARLLSAEAWTTRERMLAELEALAGMDIETLEDAP